MFDFSQNTNVFGPPKKVLKTMESATELMLEYPSSPMDIKSITEVANYFNIEADTVVVGLGATHILQNIPRVVTYSRAVIGAPTFWEYEYFNAKAGKQIFKIFYKEEDEFAFKIDSFREVLRPGDAVFLCTVNNPTSTKINRADIIQLAQEFKDVQFIVDETYLMFRNEFESESLKNSVTTHSNIHVVFSLSKFFNIPGLRLGVLVSNKDTTSFYRENIHIPYSINPMIENVIEHLFSDKKFMEDSRTFYEKQRISFYKKLNEVFSEKIHFFRPEGNFLLGKILSKGIDSTLIAEKLKNENISIRTGTELDDLDASWIRISVKSDRENEALINNLMKIFASEALQQNQ